MTFVSDLSGGVTLQNPIALLNISFIVPITVVPILALYKVGGDLFDFETVPIPLLYIDSDTFGNDSSPLYDRIGLTGSRLRSLVYAFGVVGLRHGGKIEGENTCFGLNCDLTRVFSTAHTLGGTKIAVGPQFNLIFLKESVGPQQLYFGDFGFRELLSWYLFRDSDSFMHFVKISQFQSEMIGNQVQLFCLACDENWQTRRGTVSMAFKFGGRKSFWNGLEQSVSFATSKGRRLHWSYDFEYDYNAGQTGPGKGYFCHAVTRTLGQKRINKFGAVETQFGVSLFPVANLTNLISDCMLKHIIAPRSGLRFHSAEAYEDALQVTRWKPLEIFYDEFMFVTDQNVTSKNHAAELYVKVFDIESWVAVLVAGGVTCFALAMLVKTSNKNLLGNFWVSMSYLGAYFMDQSKRLPFPEAAVRSTKALRFVVVPWMMAILILSNGFRGVMKSNYVQKFPYETSLRYWEDYRDMSLFTFVRNEDCRRADKIIREINEAWIWWAVNRRQAKDWSKECYDSRPHFHSEMTFVETLKWTDFREHRIDEWIELEREFYEDEEFDEVCFREVTPICVNHFSKFSGTEYRNNVEKWNQIALKGPVHWNISFRWVRTIYEPCDTSINYTFRYGRAEDENVIRAFQLTRRRESAYVIRKSGFPWYWNLFKKLMVTDSRVQYAHTGGAEVARKTKSAIYERNDSPFYVFVRHRYMEPANWMIRRIAAIQESGILNLWYKWDMILRPPVNESLNEEVSEEFDEVRELRLSDPGIAFLVNVAIGLALFAVAVFAVEVIFFLV